jgi:hypothetical protein
MAMLPAGRAAGGTIVSGRGFPSKVWLVSYPEADGAQIVLRDAAGHEIAHSVIAGEPAAPSQPRSGGITIFRYRGSTTVAYLIDGKVAFWEDGGSILSEKTVRQVPLAVFSALYNQEDNPQISFGYAPADVARIVLRLQDGREFSAGTVPGWPGSGVRLFGPIIMPAHVFVTGSTMILTYNAAGHLLNEVSLSKLYG